MRQIRPVGALRLSALLAALLASPWPAAQARQAQTQAQVQSPQQAQQAQQARQQAESFLRREEAAATGRQNRNTERANQDAGVADEAAAHSDAARPTRSAPPPGTTAPSYGPVLHPRQPASADPARKDPAEVHDETDSQARPGAQPSQQPSRQPAPKQPQARQTQRRRQAWQPAGPLAPRPLGSFEAAPIGYGAVPVPAPAQAPQAVVPSNTPLNSCIGGACRDVNGGSYNLGPTGVGVSSSGRLCSRTGTTVQCN